MLNTNGEYTEFKNYEDIRCFMLKAREFTKKNSQRLVITMLKSSRYEDFAMIYHIVVNFNDFLINFV